MGADIDLKEKYVLLDEDSKHLLKYRNKIMFDKLESSLLFLKLSNRCHRKSIFSLGGDVFPTIVDWINFIEPKNTIKIDRILLRMGNCDFLLRNVVLNFDIENKNGFVNVFSDTVKMTILVSDLLDNLVEDDELYEKNKIFIETLSSKEDIKSSEKISINNNVTRNFEFEKKEDYLILGNIKEKKYLLRKDNKISFSCSEAISLLSALDYNRFKIYSVSEAPCGGDEIIDCASLYCGYGKDQKRIKMDHFRLNLSGYIITLTNVFLDFTDDRVNIISEDIHMVVSFENFLYILDKSDDDYKDNVALIEFIQKNTVDFDF